MADYALVALNVLNNPSDSELYRTAPDECWSCVHRRDVQGNAHISCAKPDATVRGYRHGIERGWFMYPFLFDPLWRTTPCQNFEPKTDDHAVSHAVSQPVSRT